MIAILGVFGIGNVIMSDDGVGVVLLSRLEAHDLPPNVELIDLGVGGMNLLHKLDRFEAVLLIDAVNFGGRAGEAKVFTPEQVREQNIRRPGSLHECDYLEVIALAKKLGKELKEVVIFGVQPGEVGLGEKLSPEVEGGLDDMTEELVSLVRRISQRL